LNIFKICNKSKTVTDKIYDCINSLPNLNLKFIYCIFIKRKHRLNIPKPLVYSDKSIIYSPLFLKKILVLVGHFRLP
jgi:hypothetical protein